MFWSFLSLKRRCMDSKLHFLLLFSPRLFLAKLSPWLNSLLSIFFPSFHIFLHYFFWDQFLFSLIPLFALVCSIKPLKVVLTLFNFFEELFTHILDLNIESFIWQSFESLVLAPCILFFALTFDSFLGFSHYTLVHPSFFTVHQSFIRLLQQMESISRLFMPALIWMYHDWKHSELLLYLCFISFRSNLENIVWVNEGMV